MKLELGKTSMLELPYHLMRSLFPHVRKRYTSEIAPTDFYEHFWTGVILTAIVTTLMQISNWIGLSLIPITFVYIVVKEVIMDAKKRVNDYDWLVFRVDMTMRIAGFVCASPLLAVVLIF